MVIPNWLFWTFTAIGVHTFFACISIAYQYYQRKKKPYLFYKFSLKDEAIFTLFFVPIWALFYVLKGIDSAYGFGSHVWEKLKAMRS